MVWAALLSFQWFCAGEASAQGTHFIAEANAGVAVPMGYEGDYRSGLAMGLTFGFGGKFKDNPTRFYLIGQFNSSTFSADRVFNNKRRLVVRQVTDINGGLRMLWPVNDRLRVFGDLALGLAQIDSTASSPGLPSNILLSDTGSSSAFFTAAGMQLRLMRSISVGGKADFAFIFDEGEVDVVGRASGGDTTGAQVGRLNLYLTATLHF
jgi:hypothetical protein